MGWNLKRLFWITDEDESDAQALAPAPDSGASGTRRDSVAPASSLSETLSCFREIDGVVGSLALGNDGEVLGWDLPRLFDEDTVRALASRIAQLRATLLGDGREFSGGALVFQDYRLHVGVVPRGMVAILASDATSVPAVAMAVRLVGRRVVPDVAPINGPMSRPHPAR